MRLAWLTDLHINFVRPPAFREFLDELVKAAPDAVVITGDIGEAESVVQYLKAIAQDFGKPVYFVLGNHDYYRGSFASVRESMERLLKTTPNLRWLTKAEVVSLTSKTALVGHDTWADARLGGYERSPVMLNDFRLIEDFLNKPPDAVRAIMERCADEGAAHLRAVLPKALESHTQVICAVHVPPFREAAWHEGKPSNDDWLPFFSSKATGDAILDAAKQFPDKKLTVLCGHTHGSGEFSPLPNVTVLTGGAEYGKPTIQKIFEVE